MALGVLVFGTLRFRQRLARRSWPERRTRFR